mmetsp:Transcript_37277/g.105239  ORF Transcript_37277/g.105239 Transcript_37277/m.105239 type:complete len:241 (-) Transcript_37277:434-1156(-)
MPPKHRPAVSQGGMRCTYAACALGAGRSWARMGSKRARRVARAPHANSQAVSGTLNCSPPWSGRAPRPRLFIPLRRQGLLLLFWGAWPLVRITSHGGWNTATASSGWNEISMAVASSAARISTRVSSLAVPPLQRTRSPSWSSPAGRKSRLPAASTDTATRWLGVTLRGATPSPAWRCTTCSAGCARTPVTSRVLVSSALATKEPLTRSWADWKKTPRSGLDGFAHVLKSASGMKHLASV